MKAIIYTEYGTPDRLQLKSIDKPTPGDNEALIQIHAVSINDWDWGLLQGTPFANRAMSGLKKPHMQILGSDIAGRIVAVGKSRRCCIW